MSVKAQYMARYPAKTAANDPIPPSSITLPSGKDLTTFVTRRTNFSSPANCSNFSWKTPRNSSDHSSNRTRLWTPCNCRLKPFKRSFAPIHESTLLVMSGICGCSGSASGSNGSSSSYRSIAVGVCGEGTVIGDAWAVPEPARAATRAWT